MTVRRLAWPLFGMCVATTAAGLLLLALVPASALEREGETRFLSVTYALILLVFGLVGAVVTSRMPANPIGWLFLALAMIEGTYELASGYTHYSLAVEPLPGTVYVAWFADWSSLPSPALIGLAFLLFPDGHLLSRRWRPVAWFCVLAVLPAVAHYALAPGPIDEFRSLNNPFGMEGAAFLQDINPDVFITMSLVGAVVAVVARLRRSAGVERQQLKWFAWSACLMAGFLPVAAIAATLAGAGDDGTADYVAGFVFAVLLCGLPVSAGIAILRYRLYDIDLVINRTLVYGGLTILLAAAYLGSVLLLQLLLNPVTKQSDLAIAGSTLAAAAMFRPLRSRVQSVVDRRFYRARYDASRTLENYAVRLRDELDLEALGNDLRLVVHETIQPAHVSLWLRSSS